MEGNVEEAFEKVSEMFNIKPPRIKVGTVKRHRKAVAVYCQQNKTIYASNSEILRNPYVMLHEYYHHLQSELHGEKGGEKKANRFAKDFIYLT
jgi:hypothetical protein